MRIIMFGTGPFAVPSFQAILDSRHEVPMLVTRPVTNSGNRRKSSENPTRDAGVAAGIEIFEPDSVNDDAAIETIQALKPDLFVVCDYGQIMSKSCLAVARYGGINLHGSLLPGYRGAAPVNWAIYHGESRLGISVIHMSPKLDAGNILSSASLPLAPEDTAESIEPRLAELGVQPVLDAIDAIEAWDGESTLGVPQDPGLVTRAPRLKKQDGQIDWSRTARQIRSQIQAFQPWPGSYTSWNSPKKGPLRIIIHEADLVEESQDRQPGEVAISDGRQLVIQTGSGGLAIVRLQPAGKKPMPVADFLRGHAVQLGDRLGG